MIKKIHRKFVVMIMSMFTAILMIPLIALNSITSAMSYRQTKELMQQVVHEEIKKRNDEHMPPQFPPEEAFPEKSDKKNNIITTSITTETLAITTTVISGSTENKSSDVTEKVNNNKTTTYIDTSNTENNIKTEFTKITRESRTVPVTSEAHEFPEPPKFTHPQHDYNNDDYNYKPPIDKPDYPPYDDFHDNYWNARPDYPDNMMHPEKYIPEVQSYMYNDKSCISLNNFKYMPAGGSITDKNGEPVKRELPKKNNALDYFMILSDLKGNVVEISGTELYTKEDAVIILSEIEKQNKTDGYYENLQYYSGTDSHGKITVLSDRTSDKQLLKKLLFVSIGVFFLMEIIVLFLAMFLTKRAMMPMQVSFEKQRQFISDAGHELKTPLTIISANADILSDEIGKNKWLDYIKTQTERMRILVSELMDLAKLGVLDESPSFQKFNLSSAIENMALPFESQAFEMNRKYEISIMPDLEYTGNPEQIKRMTGIFLDNAFKYSNEGGEIKLNLKEEGNKKILSIYNTGKGIKKGEEAKIFERFYRSDTSRARETGGYGLGLSIASTIAESHKIKIQVESVENEWIQFTLII